MIEVNYLAILVCAVAAMIVGGIWYGPLFGKKWMAIIHPEGVSTEKMAKAQKGMAKLYILQFVLVLFQAYVLAHYIAGWQEASGLANSLWIWAAFVMPTVAGASMWNGESKKIARQRFFIQAGYQLVIFVVFGLILGAW